MSNGKPKLVIHKAALDEDPLPERDGRPTGAGRAAEAPIRKEDERRERAAFGSATRRRVEPPAWFVEFARSRAAPEEVINSLVERLPEIEDREVVRLVVNELGRLESAEDVLKRSLSPEVASRLHPKG
jgi:hypothetical protein